MQGRQSGGACRVSLRTVWTSGSQDEIDALRAVLREAAKFTRSVAICAEADVLEHDLRNFLNGKSQRPANHIFGLRVLMYAARWTANNPSHHLSTQMELIRKKFEQAIKLQPEEDYFFLHLKRLHVADERSCRRFCDAHSGNYFAYRLGHQKNTIVKSHIEIKSFSPYNRLPRFVNKLVYGPQGDNASVGSVERTAQGQIMSINGSVVFVGFVNYGTNESPTGPFKGMQINIFSEEQFDQHDRPFFEGVFLSYVYGGQYEYGPVKITRTDKSFHKSRLEIRQHDAEELSLREPAVKLYELRKDISQITDVFDNMVFLSSCLEYIINPTHSNKPINAVSAPRASGGGLRRQPAAH